jgi:hypothetical protein
MEGRVHDVAWAPQTGADVLLLARVFCVSVGAHAILAPVY